MEVIQREWSLIRSFDSESSGRFYYDIPILHADISDPFLFIFIVLRFIIHYMLIYIYTITEEEVQSDSVQVDSPLNESSLEDEDETL